MTTLAELSGKTDTGPKQPLADQGRSVGTNKESATDQANPVGQHKEEVKPTKGKKTKKRKVRNGKLISDLETLRKRALNDAKRIEGAIKELKKGA